MKKAAVRAAIIWMLLVSAFGAPAIADPPPDGASGLGKKVLVVPIMHQNPPCPPVAPDLRSRFDSKGDDVIETRTSRDARLKCSEASMPLRASAPEA